MTYTVREYQGRVNAIFGSQVLTVDGMMGPNTRNGINEAMKMKRVRRKTDLFTGGIRGIVWHWTAGANGLIELERDAYNWLFDTVGNTYDGNHSIQDQVNYDWRRGIGASHTKSMNTGWLGLSVDAMAGAREVPLDWGSHPITWEGIDAMLDWTNYLCKGYDIPISPWTTLSHAEVQQTLGIKQRWKWDYKVLPGYTRSQDARSVGDILRQRMMDRS